MNDFDQEAETEDAVAAAIDAAEEVRDALEGLVERAAADPGAAFAPEVLERLSVLKKDDRAAFETLRAQLKQAGCRVTELDKVLTDESGDQEGCAPKQADILISLAAEANLFHTADGTGYADLQINGHPETWPIRNKGFRRWLGRRFFEATGKAPNSEALHSAINVIESMAHYDGPERAVFIRVGGHDGKLYLDLCNESWGAVDEAGWRVIDNPPVRFRRAAGMKPLSAPVPGGSLETLRCFLNVQSDAHFVLAVSWMLAVLRHRGPYPVLVLSGERHCGHCHARIVTCSLPPPLLAPDTTPASTRDAPRHGRLCLSRWVVTDRKVVQECEISWSNLCRITGEFINMHNIPMPYENTVTATWDKSRMAEAQTMGASGASGRFASPRPS